MRFKALVGFAAIGIAIFSLPAWPHHAHGNYDVETADIEGVVTEVHLINPHSWVYMEVTQADGQKQLWALEGGGRGGAERQGHIKVGDEIKARCHASKDGTPTCLLGFIKSPSGVVQNWDEAGPSVDLPTDF